MFYLPPRMSWSSIDLWLCSVVMWLLSKKASSGRGCCLDWVCPVTEVLASSASWSLACKWCRVSAGVGNVILATEPFLFLPRLGAARPPVLLMSLCDVLLSTLCPLPSAESLLATGWKMASLVKPPVALLFLPVLRVIRTDFVSSNKWADWTKLPSEKNNMVIVMKPKYECPILNHLNQNAKICWKT